jgi:hypothetical protein
MTNEAEGSKQKPLCCGTIGEYVELSSYTSRKWFLWWDLCVPCPRLAVRLVSLLYETTVFVSY